MGLFKSEVEKRKQDVIDAVRKGYKNGQIDMRQMCKTKRAEERARYLKNMAKFKMAKNARNAYDVQRGMKNRRQTEFDTRCQAAVMGSKTLSDVFNAEVEGIPCWNHSLPASWYPYESIQDPFENILNVSKYQDDIYKAWAANDAKVKTNASNAERFTRFKQYMIGHMNVNEKSYYPSKLANDGYLNGPGRNLFDAKYGTWTNDFDRGDSIYPPWSKQNSGNRWNFYKNSPQYRLNDNSLSDEAYCGSAGGNFEMSEAKVSQNKTVKNVYNRYKEELV